METTETCILLPKLAGGTFGFFLEQCFAVAPRALQEAATLAPPAARRWGAGEGQGTPREPR